MAMMAERRKITSRRIPRRTSREFASIITLVLDLLILCSDEDPETSSTVVTEDEEEVEMEPPRKDVERTPKPRCVVVPTQSVH